MRSTNFPVNPAGIAQCGFDFRPLEPDALAKFVEGNPAFAHPLVNASQAAIEQADQFFLADISFGQRFGRPRLCFLNWLTHNVFSLGRGGIKKKPATQAVHLNGGK